MSETGISSVNAGSPKAPVRLVMLVARGISFSSPIFSCIGIGKIMANFNHV